MDIQLTPFHRNDAQMHTIPCDRRPRTALPSKQYLKRTSPKAGNRERETLPSFQLIPKMYIIQNPLIGDRQQPSFHPFTIQLTLSVSVSYTSEKS